MKEEDSPGTSLEKMKWSARAKAGAVIVCLSFIPWLCVLALPFVAEESLPWSKVVITTVLVGGGEVIQLAGIALAGPELVSRARAAFKAFKSRKKE